MTNWRLQLMNELMDLIWHYSKSSIGLSNAQLIRLKTLYKELSDSGKDYIQLWAEENDFNLPTFN